MFGRLSTAYNVNSIQFSRLQISNLYKNQANNNSSNRRTRQQPIQVLILGGGFAGIEVLKRLQDDFQEDSGIEITLVSKDNFFLFTPMLPEVSTGMIETRHIATAIRYFCKKSTTFHEGNVESIDFDNKKVIISHIIGNGLKPYDYSCHTLDYDYLVIALGSETKFFGMKDIESNALTMKDLTDAMILRNHAISMLEQADLECENHELRKKLMTFVVVGGGFSGVEIVGELNDFIRESIREYYHNIDEKDVRIVLVDAEERILPEVEEKLGDFALQKLKENSIEVILNSQATGVTKDGEGVKLNDGKTIIPTYTLVWTAGVEPAEVVTKLQCPHDKDGRIAVNYYLQVPNHPNVYALGDCVSLADRRTLKPYPPTAQVAIQQGKIVAKNISADIKRGRQGMVTFDYKTKGIMAKIGKRTGVAEILGFKLSGFSAWWLWRTFYLIRLPTMKKKLRVMIDWAIDLFFKRDVTMIKRFIEEKPVKAKDYHNNTVTAQMEEEDEEDEEEGHQKGGKPYDISEAA
jgi:NADH:ubiquinone reductase (H+-translocating)